MTINNLPLLIEPNQLAPLLNQGLNQNSDLLIVDLGNQDRFANIHLPGATYLSPATTTLGVAPKPGDLPKLEQFSQALREIGYSREKHIIVCDEEGGGWAGRFIWLLDVIKHPSYSYLNGGIHAWLQDDLPISQEIQSAIQTNATINYLNHDVIIEKDEILKHLNDPNYIIWDARSEAEYLGTKSFAAKAGHIPGAVHYEWTRAIDKSNGYRLRALNQIKQELASLGINANKTVVTHCQTHHRSGLTYLVGKLLELSQLKAYPGSWSEWGNALDTPVECMAKA